MKILHFYKTSFPDSTGGTEQVIHQIARGSVKHGIASQVLSLARNPVPAEVELDGYRIHRARLDFDIASTGFSVSGARRFQQLAREVDLIHYHFPWPFMDMVHFLARTSKPSLVTYHSDIIRQRVLGCFYRPLQNRFLASVDHIVATSPNYLETSEVLRNFKDKTSVVPIGLDRSSYPAPTDNALREWSARLGSRFFLFIGVFRYYKGLHILLEAARERDYPIVLVGAGPIEKSLKAQAKALGLRNIHFLGAVSDADKVALLTLCHALVFPSHLRSEAFGVSLLEGAMFGKPMISSEIGTGTTFVNVRNETGMVVPPGDPRSLREAMDYLWHNPQDADKMGRRAEARYLKYFTASRMVEMYSCLYESLIRGEAVRHSMPAPRYI